MKILTKILAVVLLFLSVLTMYVPEQAQAAYDITNQSCSEQYGRDIIFIIQDTPEMPKHDPEKSRVTEVLKLMDNAEAQDRFGLIGFDTKITKELALTTNKNEAKRVLTLFGTNPGSVVGNDLSQGLEKAIQELTKKGNTNEKMIVIMTVGTSINNMKLHDLAMEAYEEDIKIHTISFGDPMTVDAGTLKQIANNTGGNYNHSPNASFLWDVLSKLNQQVVGFTGREVSSNWKLTQDVHESQGLLLHENVKVDLNGYNLTVDGEIVMLSCSELRAVSGVITAKNIDQKSRSSIRLNNSQLKVDQFTQDGSVVVNGDYRGETVPEVDVNVYNQKIHGLLDVKGQKVAIAANFVQEGRVELAGGSLQVEGNVHQKGYFNVQEGKLQVNGNLTINGGLLQDDAFTENKSLNVGGGVVQVGSAESMDKTRATGNVKQTSGQLYVNHGTVRIFGDYAIADGWLTMVKGSMDTTAVDYGEGDGDYVRVYGDFSTASKRNHAQRDYVQLGKAMHDQAHLTNGVLRIDGNFRQVGNGQYHDKYSDRSQGYSEDYSRFNFEAKGKHKVLLTGKSIIDVQGSGFTFNILELQGSLGDYQQSGSVKWSQLIERDSSANADLKSLTINDIPVKNFDPNVLNYYTHHIPSNGIQGPLLKLKVDARADDHRNAKVEVIGNSVGVDGTAKVEVLVTAHDGKTTKLYTVYVTVGGTSSDAVSSIEVDQTEYTIIKNGSTNFSPSKVTIGYRVLPTTADNQRVTWTSTNPKVATVNAQGIVTPLYEGKTTIVVTTEEGGFTKSVNIEVKLPYDLLEGVKTLANLVEDEKRYNEIMALYSPSKIGIVVPGQYINSMRFTASGSLVSGKIATHTDVKRVEVRVNNQQLSAQGLGTNEYLFSRAGLSNGDYLEVIAYNNAGDELERIATSYPVDFLPLSTVPYGFYSIQRLLSDPGMFSTILDNFSPEQLRFTTIN